jgi:hypothetical protein
MTHAYLTTFCLRDHQRVMVSMGSLDQIKGSDIVV